MDYCTTTEIAAASQEFTGDPDYAAQLASAASRLFDNLCDVSEGFFAVTNDAFEDRDFIGNGTAYLALAPYTALNTVSPVLINKGDVTTPNFNATDLPQYIEKDGMLVVPDKTNQNFRLVTPDQNRFTGWPDGVQIRVSAKWGFSAVPDDIKRAVIQLAIHWFRTGDPAFTMISQSGQPYTPPAVPKQVQLVADNYKRIYNRGVLFA